MKKIGHSKYRIMIVILLAIVSIPMIFYGFIWLSLDVSGTSLSVAHYDKDAIEKNCNLILPENMTFVCGKNSPTDAHGDSMHYMEYVLKDSGDLNYLNLVNTNNKNIINEFNEQLSLEDWTQYSINESSSLVSKKISHDNDTHLLLVYNRNLRHLYILYYSM